jgi:hypothetical protein
MLTDATPFTQSQMADKVSSLTVGNHCIKKLSVFGAVWFMANLANFFCLRIALQIEGLTLGKVSHLRQ